jgi:hypothetical protein
MAASRWAALALFFLLLGGVLGFGQSAPPGVVTDTAGPMPGAVVRYQGHCPAVRSDARGHFRLPPKSTGRVTAWKSGYVIAAAPADRPPVHLHLTPLPTGDNEDYAWLDPTPDASRPLHCGNCHDAIYREWSLSAHARASTNPRMLGVYQALLADRPEDAGVCARCHAPTMTDSTATYDLRLVQGVDRQGVHCDFCHKIVDAPTDKVGLRFGGDGYQLLRPYDGQQLFFGPLDDAVREGEAFGHLPLYGESRYCASCHEGIVYGVHVYGTYSEWLASPARQQGRQCQSCHMAPTGRFTNIAPGKGGIERDPRTLASHALPGNTAAMLKGCLSLDVRLDGARLTAETTADRVGHRVPTGWIDRHLVLSVEAFDAAGQPVAQVAGPRLPAAAGTSLAGHPGYIFGKQFPQGLGKLPPAFWQIFDDPVDTRLFPGEVDRRVFVFAAVPARVQTRLIYRRFWQAWVEEYGWRDQEVVVAERVAGPPG